MRLGWIVLGGVVATTACGSLLGIESVKLAADGGGVDAGDGAVADGGDGAVADGGDGAVVDGATADACMGTPVTFSRLLPKVLLAVDRSASMMGPLTGASSRLSGIRAVLQSWRAATATSFEVGLVHFPTDNMCAVMAGLRVPLGFNNGTAIDNHLASLVPDGTSPTSAVMTEARDIMKFVPAPAGRHIILFNDGPATGCSGDGDAQVVAAIQTIPPTGTRAFTIALGTDISSGYVAQMRNAGGTAGLPNTVAQSVTELTAALDVVTDEIRRGSCALQLDGTPISASSLGVRLGGNLVPRSPSHTNGWDYFDTVGAPGVVTLYGAACGQLVAGQTISFSNGCGGLVEAPVADGGVDAATAAPVITRVSWSPSASCTPIFTNEYVVSTTVIDIDTALANLSYSGSVAGCTGSINSASSTVNCGSSPGGNGSVLVTDPQGNSALKSFTLPPDCVAGMTP
ncbi:MAG: VWA domain-containing protein [Deltaproteobacteria bacterium]|nr:VWA domain-containing protein [Deltaproteobacteria bacterium]